MIFAALDFETCHTHPDSACALAVVRCEAGEVAASKSWLIQAPVRETWMFENVHGIAREAIAAAPTFAQVWAEAQPLLAGVAFVAAHNAPFDRRVLEASLKAARLPLPRFPWRDTVQTARRAWGVFPTHLPDVCRYLGIPLDNRHDPLEDATACARIVLASMGRRVLR